MFSNIVEEYYTTKSFISTAHVCRKNQLCICVYGVCAIIQIQKSKLKVHTLPQHIHMRARSHHSRHTFHVVFLV